MEAECPWVGCLPHERQELLHSRLLTITGKDLLEGGVHAPGRVPGSEKEREAAGAEPVCFKKYGEDREVRVLEERPIPGSPLSGQYRHLSRKPDVYSCRTCSSLGMGVPLRDYLGNTNSN